MFSRNKVVWMRHEVFGTQKVLRDIVRMETGIKEIEREEILVDVIGINHLHGLPKHLTRIWIYFLFIRILLSVILKKDIMIRIEIG